MLKPEVLAQYIAAGVKCDVLEVSGDGHHFEATIVSVEFSGKSRIQQHQIVYRALGDRMREEVHALSMKTFSPEEWASKNG
ncbi:BolA family protein [Parachitinimonas caeni]|uniref:BolA/IbaG family iron-sulfur metabolism protein n=1 Tax=Parachitinimonas caeni TaxID=3031301 RepID=A0ABT7DSW2_9NEIS|nr:BolA/IbaG family iron-sulfur metabolism protein [Parachitinimonas caeni]MDK2123153.1 BolA/IbaG family iron-sulfur metabolism protein [Parachitinimonas caeni]